MFKIDRKIMNKEKYLEILAEEKEIQNESNQRLSEAREKYLESSAPSKKGDKVKITLNSGRVVEGEVNSFDIWKDKSIYITSYKDIKDNKIKYITVPPQKVEKL